MLKLSFFGPNNAWAFTFGDSIVTLEGEPMFFRFRTQAVEAAGRKGIFVGGAKHGGWCEVMEDGHHAART